MVLAKRKISVRVRNTFSYKTVAYTKLLGVDKKTRYCVEVINWKDKIEQDYVFDNFKRALLCFHNMAISVKEDGYSL
jgi:hypothetical protein